MNICPALSRFVDRINISLELELLMYAFVRFPFVGYTVDFCNWLDASMCAFGF